MTPGIARRRAIEPRDPALTRGRERVEAQRWALELSPIAELEARQAALTSAPASWQATLRQDLAWRVGSPWTGSPGDLY